ncbi:hypothetical protein NDA11_007849 [Ustilago hordei]|uniref:Uncharacterized protein n=1 Tax=Ustilago hordei TaxID=120017 RepID=I2G102_USTHO|nr:uncharacterized protein UHO2_03277 [Ustilago hordei]KAJ1041071.1 hypothetical protein NDA10_005000 [Ustilago hordei]KAJ1581160.1 hypothetical protein NDA15_005495 [Ustilago hordei]KAJ1582902.1 hypothetical protein NDA12_005300 [Ustilago hordei]KAJ1588865.1 hypothetical protein NDA11_007849 [Ustilago hordei]KAJ1599962.1 hypothetical protein NDA14_006098 [Ustilago hordei]
MRATSSFANDFGSTAHLEVGNLAPRTANTKVGRAHKKRRLIHIGSSPPPFTTGLHHHGCNKLDRTNTALTSPKATRKRRAAAAPTKNPLELRSSSPASPPPDEPLRLGWLTAASRELQPRARSQVDAATHSASRDLLQRKRQLDRSDPSSPIGTFGGQAVGRSDRNLGPSRFGSSDPAILARHPKRTVGLPVVEQPTQARSRLRSKALPAPVVDNENAEAPVQQALRTEEKVAKLRRRRTKIQRVQFGNTPPSSSAPDQPLSDADHQLISQPDAAEQLQPGPFDAADESEISYFPTLPRVQLRSTEERNAAGTTNGQVNSTPPSRISDRPPSLFGQDFTGASASNSSSPSNAAGHDQSLPPENEQASEGDSSVGLLQVLSQSAMRRVESAPTAGIETLQQQSRGVAVNPQVQVDFDASHFTSTQAEHVANSLVGSKSKRKQWLTVDPDSIAKRQAVKLLCRTHSYKVIQTGWRPPSSCHVARDLALSPAQLTRKHGCEVLEFSHHHARSPDRESRSQDDEELAPFEHGPRFVGYRLERSGSITAAGSQGGTARWISQLQPFDAEALHKRMQSRRKEVVKIIVPFSEPSLSARATRACFIAPHQTAASQARSSDNDMKLVWMQSTAQRFFAALEAMLQAGLARTAQTQSYRVDSDEADLYPYPILHYVAHAGSNNNKTGASYHNGQKTSTPSYVVLYVHLDRIAEARQKLSALELGHDADEASRCGSYRPFSDPALRLLVTSMKGEPLCLI